jgi:mannose-1-phosphate guanylyltransferase/mannose-6-phosphate isomerase
VWIVPVILSGGSGSSLCSVSRPDRPKQFIPGLVANENNMSLFQQTVKRLSGLGYRPTKPIVVCNTEHRFLVTEQLKQINAEATVLLEPIGRNTAPAITMAALLAAEAYGPNSALFVAPADHQIDDTEAFLAAARAGNEFITAGKLVTFGVVPHCAEIGFGYIHATLNGAPAAAVNQFVEKPDLATAEKYVQSGEYFWNSGMFLLPTRPLINELRTHAPAILKACDKALSQHDKTSEFIIPDNTEFELCPCDSINEAVMEKTSLAMMVPLDAGWSDAGSYAALRDLGEHDSDGNVQSGDVVMQDCKNSMQPGNVI